MTTTTILKTPPHKIQKKKATNSEHIKTLWELYIFVVKIIHSTDLFLMMMGIIRTNYLYIYNVVYIYIIHTIVHIYIFLFKYVL